MLWASISEERKSIIPVSIDSRVRRRNEEEKSEREMGRKLNVCGRAELNESGLLTWAITQLLCYQFPTLCLPVLHIQLHCGTGSTEITFNIPTFLTT